MSSLEDEQKEFILTIKALKAEKEELKLKALDEDKYKECGSEQVVACIISKDPLSYGQYEDALKESFCAESVNGSCIHSIDANDLKVWGIIDFKHRKGMIQEMQSLVDRGHGMDDIDRTEKQLPEHKRSPKKKERKKPQKEKPNPNKPQRTLPTASDSEDVDDEEQDEKQKISSSNHSASDGEDHEDHEDEEQVSSPTITTKCQQKKSRKSPRKLEHESGDEDIQDPQEEPAEREQEEREQKNMRKRKRKRNRKNRTSNNLKKGRRRG